MQENSTKIEIRMSELQAEKTKGVLFSIL